MLKLKDAQKLRAECERLDLAWTLQLDTAQSTTQAIIDKNLKKTQCDNELSDFKALPVGKLANGWTDLNRHLSVGRALRRLRK